MKLGQIYHKIIDWAEHHNVGRKLLVLLVVGTILSVIVTVIKLTESDFSLKHSSFLIFLFCLDFVFFMILSAVVAKFIAALWAERKRDQAGSKLHSRIVTIFSLLAIAPTILVAGFSAVFFNIVIQSWFNQRVETAIEESIAIAGAYLEEHQKVISANAQAMAADLAPIVHYVFSESEELNQKLGEEVDFRALDEAIVFTRNQVLGKSRFSFPFSAEFISVKDLEDAKAAPVIFASQENERVRALVAISPLTDTYLLVGRSISPIVLARIQNAEKAEREYRRLETHGSRIALKFAGIFVGIAILLLLAAVLGGLLFANKLARPIRHLIRASDEVRKGNLSVRISEEDETEELSSLTSAFNRMTSQLESQRDELMVANEQIDERRRFTEAVLAGVSAGVIGLDTEGNIHLPNQSASKLLKLDLNQEIGRPMVEVIPEMAPFFEDIKDMRSGFIEKQITLNREGYGHTLLVRLSLERAGDQLRGYVVTFDDITQLQSAQRKAAWADMARRVAHEIKNPLTPIQLSAERLKRRYGKVINEDSGTFQNCIDTIIRQVGHIGQLVGEFSSFARMPSPNIKPENLVQICKEEIFLQQHSHPELKIHFDSSLKSLSFPCDRGQMGQVLTNLIQNAVEAIEMKKENEGVITISLTKEDENVILKVIDNGIGLPAEGRERLTDPYVTFRDKGTGLGLAIVKKIVEDHGGNLSFQDASQGGAVVQIVFASQNVHHTDQI